MRQAVVDVLQNVFRGKTHTGRQTARNHYQPGVVHTADGKAQYQPQTPYHYLYKVAAHHDTAVGRLVVLRGIIMAEKSLRGLVDVGEQHPQDNHDHDVEHTDGDGVGTDETVGEVVPGERGQVEDVGGPVDGEQHREYTAGG